MKLIIGGAFQGKFSYAEKTYRITENWIDGRTCSFDEILTCGGIHHFHEYIRRLLMAGQRTQEDSEQTEKMEESETGTALAGWFTIPDITDMESRAERFAEELYRENPNLLIVSNELGYGVVPMEKFDRDYREMAGRVCTCIAEKSEEVVRVVCGIGMRIK